MLVFKHLAHYVHRTCDNCIVGIQLNCNNIGYKIHKNGWDYATNDTFIMYMFNHLTYAKKFYNKKYTHILYVCYLHNGIYHLNTISYAEYKISPENPMYQKYQLQDSSKGMYAYDPYEKYFEFIIQDENNHITFNYDLDANINNVKVFHSQGSLYLTFKDNKLYLIKHMYIDPAIQNYVTVRYIKK